MLAAYLIYTTWITTCAAFAYATIRRPATTSARYIDYFALAFFGITLLLFGWLFVVQGITPFMQGNADSGRGYQDWHLWLFPICISGTSRCLCSTLPVCCCHPIHRVLFITPHCCLPY